MESIPIGWKEKLRNWKKSSFREASWNPRELPSILILKTIIEVRKINGFKNEGT